MSEPVDPPGAPRVLPELGAPRSPEIAAFASPERMAIADATRRIIDALLTAEGADPEDLARAGAYLDAAATALGRDANAPKGTRTRVERSYADYVLRSPVVGALHPIAPPLGYAWDAEARVLRVRGTLPAAYEGPPGYAHGGMLAMLFDEVIGMGNIVAGHPGMTAALTIEYRRPTPLHVPLQFEARVDLVEGTTIHASGTCHVGHTCTARAWGKFVIVSQARAEEYFGSEHAPFNRSKQRSDNDESP